METRLSIFPILGCGLGGFFLGISNRIIQKEEKNKPRRKENDMLSIKFNMKCLDYLLMGAGIKCFLFQQWKCTINNTVRKREIS